MVIVVRDGVAMTRNYAVDSVGHAWLGGLRLVVQSKIRRLPFSCHDLTHSGDLITVGMLDLEGVRMYFSTVLGRVGSGGCALGRCSRPRFSEDE